MLIRRPSDIPPSEITPKDIYARRREFVKAAGFLGLGAAAGVLTPAAAQTPGARKLKFARSRFSTDEKQNSYKEVTTYNNYYEFGTEKSDPAVNAKKLKTVPWALVVDGEVRRPRTFGVEDLLKLPLEERVYRMRCVAAWSMRRKDSSTRRICASIRCRDAPIARSASASPRRNGSVAASILIVICSPVATMLRLSATKRRNHHRNARYHASPAGDDPRAGL